MSTVLNAVVTPNINRVLETVNAGMLLLTKRLAPAKMKVEGAEGLKNSGYFKMWSIAKHLSFAEMTAEQIAEEFYHAVQADCAQFPQSQLVWETPPKALLKRAEEAKNRPTKFGDTRDASTFEERAHAGDAANKQKTAQKKARERCEVLVERFIPTRRGSIARDLQAKTQADWRARIEKTTDHITLEKEIQKESAALYTKLEKEAERV